jgi:hypothetical protein
MARILALALALVPSVCLAQDAEKFNAKDLEKEFAPLPAFSPKQGAVDNEVIVTRDPSHDGLQAVYVVRAELKKVLEFYSARLSIKPRKVGDEDLGTVKHVFAPRPRKGDKVQVIATIRQSDDGQGVQIALLRRGLTEDEAAEGSDRLPSE